MTDINAGPAHTGQYLTVPTWEVWQQSGHGITTSIDTVGRRAVHLAGFDPDDPPPVLIWTFEANTFLEAMVLYHEHMGWEPYRPMDGVDYDEVDRLYKD